MITKAIVQAVNANGTRCKVRIPLFETSFDSSKVEAEALVSIAPGVYNNIEVGDIVFIAFEENAIEKPIIIGKLYKGADTESTIRGGGGIFNTIKANSSAVLPASTTFIFPQNNQSEYKDLNSAKKIADYIKWLETYTKSNINKLDGHFNCFKKWTQWQLAAENVEIDDGDLDSEDFEAAEPYLYQEEDSECQICGVACPKSGIRKYSRLDINKNYPNV